MIPVVDGHNDALLHAWARGTDLRAQGAADHLDLPRARRGGIVAGFFAVFVTHRDDGDVDFVHEGEPIEPERAARVAGELTSILLRLEADGALVLARTTDDVERAIADGPFAAILHFEGAEPIDPGLTRLEPLVERGLRSLGLVWSRPNAFGTGVPWESRGGADTGPGLTPAGRELVRACNELGVLVDVSHLNGAGFRDVTSLSRAPLVATHSGARAIRPGPRSLDDEQLRAIAASGGVVGIPLVGELLTLGGDARTPLRFFADHVEHVVAVAGIDHVAIGSDFDGGAMLHDVGDAEGMQRVLDALGWSEAELRKLAHENWLRVLRATWQE